MNDWITLTNIDTNISTIKYINIKKSKINEVLETHDGKCVVVCGTNKYCVKETVEYVMDITSGY